MSEEEAVKCDCGELAVYHADLIDHATNEVVDTVDLCPQCAEDSGFSVEVPEEEEDDQ